MARASAAQDRKGNQSKKNEAIIVLGMHRSGTSAFTRVLSLCGAALPRTLMVPGDGLPGDGNSVAGFWESHALREMNDNVLEAAGMTWDDLRPLDPGWLDSTEAAQLDERLSDVCVQEYSDAPLVVIKDPRICRLLPLWLRALERIGRIPAVLIPVRNPLEVAASLTRRDGFSTSKGLLLWLRHLIAAERDSRGLRRCFASYVELLSDWRGVVNRITSQLGIDLPRRDVRSDIEIEGFLDPGLRHHDVSQEMLKADTEVPEWICSAYSWALEAVTEPDIDPEPLERIGTALASAELLFRAAEPPTAPGPAPSEAASDAAGPSASLAAVTCQPRTTPEPAHAARQDPTVDPRHRLTRVERQVAELTAHCHTEPTATDRVASELAELRARTERASLQTTRRLEEISSDLERLRKDGHSERDALETTLDEHGRQLQKLIGRDHEVVRLWAEARNQERGLAELAADHALLDARLIRYGEQTGRLDVTVETLRERLILDIQAAHRRAEATAEHLKIGLGGFREDIEALRRDLDLSRGAISGLRAELGELRADQRTTNGRHRSELDSLRSGLDELANTTGQNLELDEHRGILSARGSSLFKHRGGGLQARSNPARRYTLASLALKAPLWALRLQLRRRLRLWLDARLIWRSGLFRDEYYLLRYPDVASTSIDPLGHFAKHGTSERRDPNPFFRTAYYLDHNPDVVASGINPLVHFIVCGATEGRDPGPGFDTRYYIGTTPEIADLGVNPLLHYMEVGLWQGRRPTPRDRKPVPTP